MTDSTPPGGGMPPPPVPGEMPVSRPDRPSTVTLAAGLMILQVVLSLVSMVILLANQDVLKAVTQRALEDSKQPAGADAVDAAMTFTMISIVAATVVLVVAFAVLVPLLLRGNNVARIVTWVVTGILLCCTGLGFTQGGGDAAPGWYTTMSLVMNVVGVLIYLGIIVLLLLPPSNAFFRPRPKG